MHLRTTTFVRERSINRYYDPATDQFLSVDPDLEETNQPYLYTNDDPLNLEDPLGMLPSEGLGETSAQARTAAKTYQSAVKATDAALQKNANAGVVKVIVKVLNSNGVSLSAATTDTLNKEAANGSPSMGDSLSQSEVTSFLDTLNSTEGTISTVSATFSAVTIASQAYSDYESHYGLAYTAGDIGSSLLAGAGGFLLGSAACGGAEDGIGIICGGFASYVFSRQGHDTYQGLFGH